MSLAATMTTFDLRWWNNWKCLFNSAAPSFLNIRPSDSSLPPLKPFLPLCPFPSGPLASRPAWLPAPADVYHWFIRAQNGWHFPLPAICWHCFSRCLRTSEHLDFLLPLQHFNMSHIISRLLIVQLTFLSFVFLFVMHIFKFWHITHINYWEKKASFLFTTLNAWAGLLLLSARWSKRRLSWRGFLYRMQISQRLIVPFRRGLRRGWMCHSLCPYSFTSRMYSSKIFMHWVTSTSFVPRLLYRDDICSAQFHHPQQNAVLYVCDLIQASCYYFRLACQQHVKETKELFGTTIYRLLCDKK